MSYLLQLSIYLDEEKLSQFQKYLKVIIARIKRSYFPESKAAELKHIFVEKNVWTGKTISKNVYFHLSFGSFLDHKHANIH